MTYSEYWRFVEILQIHEAAALWCGVEPRKTPSFFDENPPDYNAICRCMLDAIERDQLRAAVNPLLSKSGDPLCATVRRDRLKAWAQSIRMYPPFLFDVITLTEDCDEKPAETDADVATASLQRRRGRPPEYDWDGAMVEMFRITAEEGLPETGAQMIDKVLLWFRNTFDREPARSIVSNRIGVIYRGLRDRGVIDNSRKPSDPEIQK
jgi:hypothetical protein